METKTYAPSFTVSLRGYDREEVDEYLDSLAEALAQVSDAEEHARRLQAHVARCNARIKELEDRIRADTPKSGIALGERIGVLLHEAEEAAAEAIARAEADATLIVSAAQARSAEADELMRNVTSRAEEQARRIETLARGEAAEIVAEAEARAGARSRQIEQWAEQVVSHTRAEEARMFVEQQKAKEAATFQLRAMEEQRAAAAATLLSLRDAIGQAVGLIEEEPDSATSEGDALAMDPAASQLMPEKGSPAPAHLAPASSAEDAPEDDTAESAVPAQLAPSGHGAEDMPEAEQLEAKLDAWVAGAAE